MGCITFLRKVAGVRIMKMNSETQGFYFDVLFRAPLFISIMFLSTAFLQFANKDAGCTKGGYEWKDGMTEEESEDLKVPCQGRAYGIRPSSLLTTLSSASAVVIAVTLPVIGSFVDHTSSRKRFVTASACAFWASNFVQIFAGYSNWFFMVLVQCFLSATSYMIHSTSIMAYTTEILDDNDADLLAMNASVRIWELISILSFMIVVTVIGMLFGLNEIQKSAVSQVSRQPPTVFVLSSISFLSF